MSNVNIIFVLTSESQLRWLLAPTEEMKGKKKKRKEKKKRVSKWPIKPNN
jgi:hypothetical protein